MTEKKQILKALGMIYNAELVYICHCFEQLPKSVVMCMPEKWQYHNSLFGLSSELWFNEGDLEYFIFSPNNEVSLRETILCLALSAYDDLKD